MKTLFLSIALFASLSSFARAETQKFHCQLGMTTASAAVGSVRSTHIFEMPLKDGDSHYEANVENGKISVDLNVSEGRGFMSTTVENLKGKGMNASSGFKITGEKIIDVMERIENTQLAKATHVDTAAEAHQILKEMVAAGELQDDEILIWGIACDNVHP